jgi:hypothetical protein
MNKVIFAYDKGYRITKDGKAIGINGNELKLNDHKGYKRLNFRNGVKISHVYVHRLQAYQKFGDKLFEEGQLVRHLDGDSNNNSWDNIELGTNSDNMMDMSAEIRLNKALHATSFWRKHDKGEVRAYYSEHKSYKKTMEHFNITSKGTLHFILNK